MRVVIFLIVMLVSAIMGNYTGKTVFWMYLGTLTLSCLLALPFSKKIIGLMEDCYGTSYIYHKKDEADSLSIAFAICYIVICGSATFAVWYGIPWLNTLIAVAVIPIWLLLTHSISSVEDRGDLAIVKLLIFLTFIGGFAYFGFYEAVGVLVVTAGLRALIVLQTR